jgi:hypothetical protein
MGREFEAGAFWVWILITAARNIIFGRETKKGER